MTERLDILTMQFFHGLLHWSITFSDETNGSKLFRSLSKSFTHTFLHQHVANSMDVFLFWLKTKPEKWTSLQWNNNDFFFFMPAMRWQRFQLAACIGILHMHALVSLLKYWHVCALKEIFCWCKGEMPLILPNELIMCRTLSRGVKNRDRETLDYFPHLRRFSGGLLWYRAGITPPPFTLSFILSLNRSLSLSLTLNLSVSPDMGVGEIGFGSEWWWIRSNTFYDTLDNWRRGQKHMLRCNIYTGAGDKNTRSDVIFTPAQGKSYPVLPSSHVAEHNGYSVYIYGGNIYSGVVLQTRPLFLSVLSLSFSHIHSVYLCQGMFAYINSFCIQLKVHYHYQKSVLCTLCCSQFSFWQ